MVSKLFATVSTGFFGVLEPTRSVPKLEQLLRVTESSLRVTVARVDR
jgi:hypothetical protein